MGRTSVPTAGGAPQPAPADGTGSLPLPGVGWSSRVAPELLALTAVASVQIGGALATKLFGRIGAPGAGLLRLVFSALVLFALSRPRLVGRTARSLWLVVVFGVVVATMNVSFYLAIDRIPLGVAVTIEFTGPLAVALFGSRRLLDVVWAVLAAGGVGLLTSGGGAVHTSGVLFALLAGACWGSYILLSQAVGRQYAGSSGLTVALAVGAVAMLPWGIVSGGAELLAPNVLALAFVVAVLMSALPYVLELAALRRLPAHVFGVLMSVEPGAGAIAGFLIIGQTLSLRALAALVMVSLASAGSALAHRRATVLPEP